jgi:hypothetical protein
MLVLQYLVVAIMVALAARHAWRRLSPRRTPRVIPIVAAARPDAAPARDADGCAGCHDGCSSGRCG